jgi:ribonuclease HI
MVKTKKKKKWVRKWYVVWHGHQPGVFKTWKDCQARILDFPNARYKSFPTEAEALEAFDNGPSTMATIRGPQNRFQHKPESFQLHPNQTPVRKASTNTGKRQDKRPRQNHRKRLQPITDRPIPNALVVDGACNLQTGNFEFQGLYLHDRRTAFKSPVLPLGTNNLAEFLGLVAGLRHVADAGLDCVVYSDSITALAWVRRRAHKCAAVHNGLVTPEVAQITEDAIDWLKSATRLPACLKWETRHWGENPADYGRK